MGVENTYSLKLNGAPYVVGGIAILGDAIGNSLSAKSGSRVDIHTAPFYKNEMGKSFGIHKAMDMAGSAIGIFLAYLLLKKLLLFLVVISFVPYFFLFSITSSLVKPVYIFFLLERIYDFF